MGAPRSTGTPLAAPDRLEPARSRADVDLEPRAFEQHLARLQRDGRYEDMWSLLAGDAQRSWGDPAMFAEHVRRQSQAVELIGADVQDVELVSEWTDSRAGRTYHNVARLDVTYRIRQGKREWALRRRVHLVPAAHGWRTLWYR